MPVAIDGLKVCTGCDETLPVARFSRQSACGDGLNPKCKACRKAVEAARYANNRDLVIDQSRWRVLKHRYGITRDEYEARLAEQGELCAICRGPQRDIRGAYLCVDHDHKTGEIRGLLCSPCNSALGHMQDDTTRLLRAVDYLRSGSDRSHR